MFDPYEPTIEFALIERIAVALREELGSEIEEQPALRDPAQAGQVNRAYRVVALTIFKTIVPAEESLPDVLNWVLTRIARRRLADCGLDEQQASSLLGMEPADRDDWLAFLILTTPQEVERILHNLGSGQ
jgi:hypothetical protein